VNGSADSTAHGGTSYSSNDAAPPSTERKDDADDADDEAEVAEEADEDEEVDEDEKDEG
jgi:hypothetical protein